MLSRSHTRPAALLAAAAALLALTGCTAEVPMTPAADANDPLCASVIVTLPETVSGVEKRRTNAQATGAWGTPASVLLHCGVTPPGPTEMRCVSVNGVDWIVDETEAEDEIFRFTTYGRTPAVEVYVNNDPAQGGVSGVTALTDLSSSVARIPQTRACTAIGDPEAG